mmetsp:Transcript_62580/g.123661  ORF Transcript_62580/g.123661 Transcript_62580/m.123661 type:complete len:88 (-) Transcript_62580:28-291(-)
MVGGDLVSGWAGVLMGRLLCAKGPFFWRTLPSLYLATSNSVATVTEYLQIRHQCNDEAQLYGACMGRKNIPGAAWGRYNKSVLAILV